MLVWRLLPRHSAPRDLALLALAGALLARAAGAQQGDSLSREATLQRLDTLIAQTARASRLPSTAEMTHQALRAQPGSSSGSAGAWGANWGDLFFGAGYQSRARYTSLDDGSVSAGFGLGNSARYLGLEVALSSASTLRRGFGHTGSVSLKLHRLLPGAFGVALGFENVANWGGTDGGSSVYTVVSHTEQLRRDASAPFGSIAWNVGVGTDRYLTESDLRNGRGGANLFGSAGVRIHPRASIVGDWTGQDLTAALSFIPFARSPLAVSAGWADLTRTAGDGPRFILGAGMGFRARDLLPRR